MKWFKLFDIGIQVMITIVAIVCFNRMSFSIFYFGLGGWQVLSCFIHFMVYDSIKRDRQRRAYERFLVWVLGIALVSGGLGWLEDMPIGYAILLLEGAILLPVGAAMAITYCINCIYETRHLFDDESIVPAAPNDLDS